MVYVQISSGYRSLYWKMWYQLGRISDTRPCTFANTLVEIRYPKTLVTIHLALESLRPRHTANVKSCSPRHEPEMGKPFDDCYWFINFLEICAVDSPHHTLTPPSSTLEAYYIHHTTFCPKLRISDLPSDSNARQINHWFEVSSGFINPAIEGCTRISARDIIYRPSAIWYPYLPGSDSDTHNSTSCR